jgi:UDPglucose 6-dehydrogenase
MVNISILGSGVVGFATGVGLQWLGHNVTFVDIDADRLAALRNGGHMTQHVDEMTLNQVDAVFVAVPTPAADGGIETSYLDQACKTLARLLQTSYSSAPPIFVFRSTMPPGTTRERIIPALESGSGRRLGDDFLICYNPEYLREETSVEDFQQLKLLTFGTAEPGDAASRAIRGIFDGFRDATITELSFEEAEFQKYVHNVFNATKISFFNEMRAAAVKLGISNPEPIFSLTAKTAEAAWNPLYGTRDRGPFGGACLPKDTAAWASFTRVKAIDASLVEAVRSVNVALGGKPC